MNHLLLLIAFLLPALAQAAEQPDWKQLQQLLGKPIAAQSVVDFVRTHKLEKTAKGQSGLFTPPHHSYSVHFEKDIVNTIQLMISPWPKGSGGRDWTHYTRPLPGGLASGDDRKSVERKLGSPIDPGGSWWMHGELTIWVIFDKQKSAIVELYVWRTKDKP